MKSPKQRKAYPSLEERLVMVNAKIEHLEKLNSEREALIAKTEKTLNERKEALRKSQNQLDKALARRARLNNIKSKPNDMAARAEKAAEKKSIENLLTAMKAKGLSIDDVVASLNDK